MHIDVCAGLCLCFVCLHCNLSVSVRHTDHRRFLGTSVPQTCMQIRQCRRPKRAEVINGKYLNNRLACNCVGVDVGVCSVIVCGINRTHHYQSIPSRNVLGYLMQVSKLRCKSEMGWGETSCFIGFWFLPSVLNSNIV